MTRSQRWKLVLVLVVDLLAAGCSLLNRAGPDVTCNDLGNAINACREGIIADCEDGKSLAYTVCSDADACEQHWQPQGAFRCEQDSPGPMQGPLLSAYVVNSPSVSPGETLTMSVEACNGSGGTAAYGIRASLFEIDPDVVIRHCEQLGQACGAPCDCSNVGEAYAFNVGDGQTCGSGLTVTFDLAQDAAVEPLQFGIKFLDETGRFWNDEFTVKVAAP